MAAIVALSRIVLAYRDPLMYPLALYKMLENTLRICRKPLIYIAFVII